MSSRVPAKRPRDDDKASQPPAKLQRHEEKLVVDAISESMKLVESGADRARAEKVLLQVFNQALKLLHESRRSLELGIGSQGEAFEAKGVMDMLKACGWRKHQDDETKMVLQPLPKFRISMHRALGLLSKQRALLESSSSEEKSIYADLLRVQPENTEEKDRKMAAEDCKDEQLAKDFNQALDLCFTNSDQRLVRGMFRAFLQILKKIEKKPSDARLRKIPCSGIISKKFIEKPKGGPELIKSLGFEKEQVQTGSKSSLCYVLKDPKPELIRSGIAFINKAVVKLTSKGNQPPAPPAKRTLCPSCRDFFGSSDKDGLCSVCYKEKTFGLPRSKAEADKKERGKGQESRWKKAFAMARLKLRALRLLKKGMKTKKRQQQNKSRCYHCKKKVGYLGFECKCMFVFCDMHRFPDAHGCKFDYKRHHRNKLKKDNQALTQNKMTKID